MKSVTMALISWTVLTAWTWLTLPFSWLVPISTGITVGILYAVAIASGTRGWSLFRLLAVLYGGIGVINIYVENLVFRIMSPTEVAGGAATGLLAAVGVAAALAWGRMHDQPTPHATASEGLSGGVWWKLPLLGGIYVVLFLTAGALIFPFVRSFYAQSGLITMPSFRVLVLTEFIRGLIHAGASLPFLHRMAGRRKQAAILAGFALPILGGIAALLMPVDDVLPMDVRRVHMVEIFGSNFVFGVLTAFLLVPPAPIVSPAPAHAAGQNESG
jgi:hypothetical protein